MIRRIRAGGTKALGFPKTQSWLRSVGPALSVAGGAYQDRCMQSCACRMRVFLAGGVRRQFLVIAVAFGPRPHIARMALEAVGKMIRGKPKAPLNEPNRSTADGRPLL